MLVGVADLRFSVNSQMLFKAGEKPYNLGGV
jgi:hypothetical protein